MSAKIERPGAGATVRAVPAQRPAEPPPLTEDATAIVAVAAHELKNALGGIGVALARCEQRLRGGAALREDDLAGARKELGRLSAMVNDLLDGARVDLGMMPIEPAIVDASALIREVVETFQEAREREVTLTLPAGPVMIEADGERVRAVLFNFLENAAKYAPEPAAITVGLGPDPGGRRARISVRDEGPGIPAVDQQRLFQRFFRAPSVARRTRGLGLGLYVCRAIAEAHGGAVGVDSQPGAGATFWLDLPVP